MPVDPTPATASSPDGVLETRPGVYVLRFARHYDYPAENVWAALTEPEKLVQWLGQADLDLVEGGHIELRWLNTDVDHPGAVLHGTITALAPPRLIEYLGDIHGRLRWEVRPEGDGCLLTLSSELAAPNDYLTMSLAGWHVHLDHLDEALAGYPVDWPAWWRDRYGQWQTYHARYVARYG